MTNYELIKSECSKYHAKLIVVTKLQDPESILKLYNQGHRYFAENKAQALTQKKDLLPKDIEWHMIGHLQKNKVKSIIPFIANIQSVDSYELALEINKQAQKISRIIPILLQIKISSDESKYGFEINGLMDSLKTDPWHLLENIEIKGVMGIGSLVTDRQITRKEFRQLKNNLDKINRMTNYKLSLTEISMGMSGDYQIALEEGSTMIRVGTLVFADLT
ncbi:MAG: YggS family pyridoxal phosphate-dependent enzyme [Saprospiraceae bacterium]|nr:YggS family pyridoxal phosphate-dependent enzyme [Candidatus Vicinibacter affinis]